MLSVTQLLRWSGSSSSLLPLDNRTSTLEESQNWDKNHVEECSKSNGSSVHISAPNTKKKERDTLKQNLKQTQILLHKTQNSWSLLEALKEEEAKSLNLVKKKVKYQNDCERHRQERDQLSREKPEINSQFTKMKGKIQNLQQKYDQERTLRIQLEDHVRKKNDKYRDC